jgi:hypothetical protein
MPKLTAMDHLPSNRLLDFGDRRDLSLDDE